jgi:hypothetical protein
VNFEGSVRIQSPPDRVWAFLTDPQAVAECAPGLEKLDIVEAGRRFRAVAAVGLGSMRARFDTDIEWTELEPPRRARMQVRGRAPGSTVDAASEMTLSEPDPGTTELAWTAQVSVQGTIASLAARMMGSAAQRLSREFFGCVKRKLEGQA